ncbi:MAG TPA: hypothetical protein PK264_11375 [Hyphomicrobiaceae bacterium]|nr:hypothetical protein [Hyphomicrobiaceae bacterium]
MRLFNLSISLITFGGSAYALIRADRIPGWAKGVAIAGVVISGLHLAMTLVIQSPEIGHGISYIRTQLTGRLGEPVRQDPSWTRTATPPVAVAYKPCVALAMSLTGQWAVDGGASGCEAHGATAARACAQKAGGPCSTHASGGNWVAGVTCAVQTVKGIYSRSFASNGDSEEDAYARAFASAERQGLQRPFCRPAIASPLDASLARQPR